MNRQRLQYPIEHIGPNGVLDVKYAAAHEAGHAVIARVFGILAAERVSRRVDGVIGFAITAPRAAVLGMWARRGKFRRPEAAIRAQIIIACAAAEAELLFYDWHRGDGGDRKNIARLLALLPERSRREDRLRAFARQLVRRHEIAIGSVAAALSEKLELTGRKRCVGRVPALRD